MLTRIVGANRFADRRIRVFARSARYLRLRVHEERRRFRPVDAIAVAVDVKARFRRIRIKQIRVVDIAIDRNAAFTAVGIDLIHIVELYAQLAFVFDTPQRRVDRSTICIGATRYRRHFARFGNAIIKLAIAFLTLSAIRILLATFPRRTRLEFATRKLARIRIAIVQTRALGV